MDQVLKRRPIEVKLSRRTAQQLVDACGVEQDLLIGLALSGKENSAARIAVDVAVLCASVGRALGLSILSVADLATAAILHSVGQAYPNPDPNQIGPHQSSPRLPFVSLLRGPIIRNSSFVASLLLLSGGRASVYLVLWTMSE